MEPDAMFDRVVMNPPFSNRQDVRHVLHALRFLRPGGKLVAIMAAGIELRTDKLSMHLRGLIQQRGGKIERLPEDAFKASGTLVRTVLVTIGATP